MVKKWKSGFPRRHRISRQCGRTDHVGHDFRDRSDVEYLVDGGYRGRDGSFRGADDGRGSSYGGEWQGDEESGQTERDNHL